MRLLAAREMSFEPLCKSYTVRNPDDWFPDGAPRSEAPDTRRSALFGLLIIVFLVVGGLALTHVLGGMSRLQDCALSGSSNCAH
jgi:hypothetical protein